MPVGNGKSQHPGEVLQRQYLEPAGTTPYDLAKAIHVSESTITSLINEETSLTVGLAIRLAKAFPLSVQDWILLQRDFDEHHNGGTTSF